MFSVAEMEKGLTDILDRWVEIELDAQAQHHEWLRSHGGSVPDELKENGRKIILDQARETEPHLKTLLRDNSDKTADELEALASKLSPGGAHTGGLLARLIDANLWAADPLLLAALIRYNWHGGKVGFQFLPDPAQTDPDSYEGEAWSLIELFDRATDGDPRRILTGEDLAFFDSLPDHMTIYRGCSGISLEQAATGLCWTTKRDIAEWFATRKSATPILVTARVRKSDIRLVKASEYEVVTIPRRARMINCRRRKSIKWRPAMEWAPTNSGEPGVKLRKQA